MSGTIVERRDQVFKTFFSLRAFSPSTFTCRCPSTNGPFLVERPIDFLFLHAAQTRQLRVSHLFKSSHRTRYSVRPRTKRANKSRAHRVWRAVHNHRPTRLAQLVQHRLQRNRHNFCCRLRGWLYHRALHNPFYGSLHGPGPPSCSPCGSSCSRLHLLRSPRPVLPSPAGNCVLTSCAPQSCDWSACCCGSSCLASGKPTGLPD